MSSSHFLAGILGNRAICYLPGASCSSENHGSGQQAFSKGLHSGEGAFSVKVLVNSDLLTPRTYILFCGKCPGFDLSTLVQYRPSICLALVLRVNTTGAGVSGNLLAWSWVGISQI